jgi:O-antigen ligase
VVLLSLLALSMRRSGLNRAMDLAKTPGGLAVGALLGGCLLSTLWAPIPLDAVEPALRLIGLVLLGLAALAGARTLDEETRVFAARCLLVGLAVMLVLFLVERATGSGVRDLIRGAHGPHGLTKTSRGSVVLGIVLWPGVGLLAFWLRRRALAIGLWAASALVIFSLNMSASKLGFLLASGVFVVALQRPRLVVRTLQAGLVGLMLLAPAVPRYVLNQDNLGIEGQRRLPESWQHRVQIWQFTAGHIAEKPLFGAGFDASRTIPGQDQPIFFYAPDGSTFPHSRLFSLHPHNAYLHVWMELGAVGAVLAALAGASLLGLILRLSGDRRVQALAAATAMSFLVNASVSFGIWQSWFLASAVLGAFALVLVAGLVSPARPSPSS